MNDRELRDLARWLCGRYASEESVAYFVRAWKKGAGMAERWAEVRAREERVARRNQRGGASW